MEQYLLLIDTGIDVSFFLKYNVFCMEYIFMCYIEKSFRSNANKEASRLYAELLLCVCLHTEHI